MLPVSACFFLNERLLREAPTRHQRHRHVMVPTAPISYLIIRQPAFTFRLLKFFLDRMAQLRHPRILLRRDRTVRIRQIIIVLNTPFVHEPDHHQSFLPADATVDLRLDPADHHVDLQWPLRTISYDNMFPLGFRLLVHPLLDTDERHLSGVPLPWYSSTISKSRTVVLPGTANK